MVHHLTSQPVTLTAVIIQIIFILNSNSLPTRPNFALPEWPRTSTRFRARRQKEMKRSLPLSIPPAWRAVRCSTPPGLQRNLVHYSLLTLLSASLRRVTVARAGYHRDPPSPTAMLMAAHRAHGRGPFWQSQSGKPMWRRAWLTLWPFTSPSGLSWVTEFLPSNVLFSALNLSYCKLI